MTDNNVYTQYINYYGVAIKINNNYFNSIGGC